MGTGRSSFWIWVATAVLSVVVVVLLNLALAPWRTKIDLTEDGRHTLPEAAKTIAAGVEDTLVVTNYLSEDLPSYLRHLPAVMRERLEEFREASKERIEFEFVDPSGDDELKAELKTRKIEAVQGQDREEGKVSIGEYWLWMVFRYGDQETTFNLAQLGVQTLRSQEAFRAALPYVIASRLTKLQNPDKKIGILSEKKIVPPQILQQLGQYAQMIGQEPTDGIKGVRQRLGDRYAGVQDVVLRGGQKVPEGIETLVLYRPEDLTERALFEIDQWMMAGNRVVVLLDNFPFFELDKLAEFSQAKNKNEVPARILKHNLGPWLAHYGVEVGDGWVADTENAKLRQPEYVQKVVRDPRSGREIPLRMPSGRMLETDVSGFVVARELAEDKSPSGQFADDDPILAGLGLVSMIYPAPLSLDPAAKERHPDAQVRSLLRTSPEAWVVPVEGDTVPLGTVTPAAGAERRARPLVVHASGTFKSYFAGKEVPAPTQPDGTPMPARPGDDTRTIIERSTAQGHLLVFADSDFLQDLGPAIYGAQEATMGVAKLGVGFVNAIDSVTLGDELSQIRRPLLTDLSVREKLVDDEKGSILWWTVGFAPVLLIALGLLRWLFRGAMTRVPSPQRTRRLQPLTAPEEPVPAGAVPGDNQESES